MSAWSVRRFALRCDSIIPSGNEEFVQTLTNRKHSRNRKRKSRSWDEGSSTEKVGLDVTAAVQVIYNQVYFLVHRLHTHTSRVSFSARLNTTMHLRFIVFLFSICLCISPLHAQNPSPPLTVDQLVAKNIEAKGGAAAISGIKSLRVTGKMLVNNGQMQLAYAQTKKSPGEVRTEATLQGMTLIQAYDGKDGWKVSPFQGRKDPEKLSADDCKSLVEDAEIAGPLVDWKEKGSTVSYAGTEDVEGTEAYKLKVVRKNGDVSFVYLDPDHFLDIRVLSQRVEQGAQIEVETDLGDYEKINGVFFPFSIESGPKNAPDKQKIVLEKAEANVPVEDALFHFPTAAAK